MNSLQVIRSKNIWAQHAQEQVDLAAKNYNSRSLRVEKFLPAEYYSIATAAEQSTGRNRFRDCAGCCDDQISILINDPRKHLQSNGLVDVA